VAALALPAERRAMWVMEVARIVAQFIGMVGENVVDELHPGAQAGFRRLEHMFVTLRFPSDGRR
jgi:hypothetical protein